MTIESRVGSFSNRGPRGRRRPLLPHLDPPWHLEPGKAKLIPEDKVGTITFTQRDVPGRIGIAASAAGVPPRWATSVATTSSMTRTMLARTCHCLGGWKELFEFLASVGIKQVEFAGYGQNANNPGGGTASTRRRAMPTGRCGLPRVRRSTCAASSTSPGSRAIGNHGFIPNTWPGPGSAGGGDDRRG